MLGLTFVSASTASEHSAVSHSDASAHHHFDNVLLVLSFAPCLPSAEALDSSMVSRPKLLGVESLAVLHASPLAIIPHTPTPPQFVGWAFGGGLAKRGGVNPPPPLSNTPDQESADFSFFRGAVLALFFQHFLKFRKT